MFRYVYYKYVTECITKTFFFHQKVQNLLNDYNATSVWPEPWGEATTPTYFKIRTPWWHCTVLTYSLFLFLFFVNLASTILRSSMNGNIWSRYMLLYLNTIHLVFSRSTINFVKDQRATWLFSCLICLNVCAYWWYENVIFKYLGHIYHHFIFMVRQSPELIKKIAFKRSDEVL